MVGLTRLGKSARSRLQTSFALNSNDAIIKATLQCIDSILNIMTTDQPNTIPTPPSAPPPLPPSKPSTPSLTARLHTLPTHWLTAYRTYVLHNPSQITTLESFLRSLTYLLPSTLQRSPSNPNNTPGPLLSTESLQTFLSLLVAYNTHLLSSTSPPSTPHARYDRFWATKSAIYARCGALLRTIQYTQLLLEMLAKRAGEKTRWRVVVILEVVKALCRVGMGRASGGRMVVGTGVGDERVERNGDAMGEEGVEVDGGGKGGSGEWKMPRTGGRLPALPTSSSTVASSSLYTGIEGVGGAGKETIAAFLSSRVLTPDDIKSAHRLVRTLHSLPALLAESLYILRPVLYALALQRCHPDKKDWRPWLLGLGMELAARQLRIGDAEGGLSEVEREEGKRRGLGLLWWGMRGAFYENATRGVVRGVVGRLKGRAVLDMVGVVLEDYDVLWGEYYFPTATL